ncbi:MAG: hypothetical protein GFH27_549395n73 [Chloroflexi bacterium AL-W]|nr:hypothetical protein [Chloroflexi bacterium AL-W]
MGKAADVDWALIRAEMRQLLIGLARMGKTICYSDLAIQIRTAYIHHRAPMFSRLLIQISDEDEQAGRPSLATLVVNKATGRPGGGYFKHAARAHDANKPGDFDPEAYWQARFDEICDYWQTHEDEGQSA